MTAVGMFAGRGDVVLGMLVVAAASFWLGYYVRGRVEALRDWWAARRASK